MPRRADRVLRRDPGSAKRSLRRPDGKTITADADFKSDVSGVEDEADFSAVDGVEFVHAEFVHDLLLLGQTGSSDRQWQNTGGDVRAP